MKLQKKQTTSLSFTSEAGHDYTIIGQQHNDYYLMTSDGIITYNAEEMIECYGMTHKNLMTIIEHFSN